MTGHFVLLADGTQQKLSSGLEAGFAGDGKQTLKFLSIQALSSVVAVCYVGSAQRKLSSSSYGWRIEIPVSTVPYAPTVLEGNTVGFTTLNQIAILGTDASTEKFAVFYII